KVKATTKRSKKAAEDDEAPAGRRRQPEVDRDQVILVNAKDPEDTRVVVVNEGRIVDLQMTVAQHKSYVNDIYRGRVVNIESAIGAAFVDFGQGRNGFLHVSDVMDVYGEEDWSLDKLLAARTDVEEWSGKGPKPEEFDGDEAKDGDGKEAEAKDGGKKAKGKKDKGRARRGRGRRKTVDEVLEKGQLLVGQITKDAIGDKGPTLTTYISIPGRYLVLMPSLQRTGVSRKIEDEKERKRLKRILSGLSIPDGMGVIVRTAGVGKTKSEIKRDLDYLLAVWSGFSEKLVLGRSPAPLYQESDVAIRTMRDLFSARTEKVVVDDQSVFERMVDFTKQLMPEHTDRIVLHEGNRPLFHDYSIEQDFEKVFARRVELPSGGSIMIDQTEALVAIDVNSGRTRDDGADFEDIALKTNLEAVPEIARQIRLRDMGGILVIDFIDMLRQASRRKVEKALRDRLADDRARSKIGRISQFGLLEMTRQRLGPGLSKLLYDTCSACRGSGRRRTAQSRAQALLRRLGSALTQKGFTKIEILAHPDTIEWLKTKDRSQLKTLEEKYKRELVFKPVEDQTEDSIFHYLRADGREVRPGGRRKR
ncbi:MAG: Rne/Rng family ribonuclease, partial [Planctomycetota bacterium]